jgi:calmodulin
LNAFKAYDSKKTGVIHSKELRSILTTTGEKLSNKDVDVILRETGGGGGGKDGKINYQQIVKVLSNPIADY